ncbi:MAG: hypothetical protein R3F11_01435 [Verrucomicrobiales bacterium]
MVGAADPGDAVLDEIDARTPQPVALSFDKMTGDLWITDVGADDWEESSYLCIRRRTTVARHRRAARKPGLKRPPTHVCQPQRHHHPADLGNTAARTGTSITGSFVYRGSRNTSSEPTSSATTIPAGSGRSKPRRRVGDPRTRRHHAAHHLLRRSRDGTLYVADRGTNQIYRIADTQNADYLRITEAAVFGPSLRITFGAEIGKSYRLQCSDSMAAGDWQYITDPEQAADYQHAFFAPAPDGTPAARFYRVAEVEVNAPI